MSTGIVSVDLSRGGWAWASWALLAVAAAAWLGVAVRGALWREISGVPASCVLAVRLAGAATGVACALTAAGAALWWKLAPRTRRRGRATGSDFLPVVATQALSVAAATLAGQLSAGWLRVPAAALLGVGVALYVHVLARFDPRELRDGPGDQWVAGGALAISALAAATLAGAWPALDPVAVAVWIAALAWLPVLVAGEALHPRLGGMPARWSTVFPTGMYAAMTFAVGTATDTSWMRVAARAWTWVAVGVWALVLARWAVARA